LVALVLLACTVGTTPTLTDLVLTIRPDGNTGCNMTFQGTTPYRWSCTQSYQLSAGRPGAPGTVDPVDAIVRITHNDVSDTVRVFGAGHTIYQLQDVYFPPQASQGNPWESSTQFRACAIGYPRTCQTVYLSRPNWLRHGLPLE